MHGADRTLPPGAEVDWLVGPHGRTMGRENKPVTMSVSVFCDATSVVRRCDATNLVGYVGGNVGVLFGPRCYVGVQSVFMSVFCLVLGDDDDWEHAWVVTAVSQIVFLQFSLD